MKCLVLLAAALTLVPAATWAQPIVDYVNKPDEAFAWTRTSEEELPSGATLTHLQVTSQVWQGITWTHRVGIIRPANLQYPDTALMLITGGAASNEELAYLSVIAGSVSATSRTSRSSMTCARMPSSPTPSLSTSRPATPTGPCYSR